MLRTLSKMFQSELKRSEFFHQCCYIGPFFCVLYRAAVYIVGTLTKWHVLHLHCCLQSNNFNVISLSGVDRVPAMPLSQRPIRHLHIPSCGPADNHLYEDHHGRGRDHTGWVPENDTNLWKCISALAAALFNGKRGHLSKRQLTISSLR